MGCGASQHSQLLPHPKVATKYGEIEGKRYLLRDRRVVNVFLGIPFAAPPIGDRRFRRPESPQPWNETLQCKLYKKRPMQPNFIWDLRRTGKGVSEDCLYLNIMAPAWENKEFKNGYPVFLYVHGGGYVLDSAAGYRYQDLSKQLVSKEVIAVTIEYRLAYFGFFCLDDKHCKGNFGMWDQAKAIKFVKDNIAKFGGDPEKITLCGQSAGGTSTDLLSLSPITRGLFQQKICMAGSAENQWAMSEKEWVIKFCREKALAEGFERTSDSEEWTEKENQECMEFLRKLPAGRLNYPVHSKLF
ncbi:unnamed protein product [Bursaphelenchus xylophilus]|uniref:Carboxylic ester hydrolase n=1 Tax=Bursaphelenchus xylophilus TaxID=6326 RepID=A0A1I7RK63_BURXY|nr:unnamed protein product [Bursaphelenchus xylophilus]CAG9131475.1 unnamed protein product [Bursaphelenchus xylophilus]